MKHNYHMNSKLENLQLIWYEKLKKSGFDDIEIWTGCKGDHDNSFLKYSHQNLKYNTTRESYLLALHYYQSLRNFSESPQFKLFFPKIGYKNVKILRKITNLYGNGHSIRYISRHLRRYWKLPSKKLGRSGQAYSYFWVFSKLKVIKQELFNYTKQQDANKQDSFSTIEFMESNRD
jgi:hypothetical protein